MPRWLGDMIGVPHAAPWVFYDEHGHQVVQNDQGFYNTSCPFLKTCCKAAEWVDDGTSVATSLFYGVSALAAVVGIYWSFCCVVAEDESAHQPLEDETGDTLLKKPVTGYASATIEVVSGGDVQADDTEEQGDQYVFLWLFITIAVVMATSVVQQMVIIHGQTPAEAAAMNDADNFLTPVMDIFQFFEYGMTVKIAQAIGAGDFAFVGQLVRWGTLCGLGLGALGVAASLSVMSFTATFGFFVHYGGGDSSVSPSCVSNMWSLEELRRLAKPYWIVTTMGWPGAFMEKAFTGALLGMWDTWSAMTITGFECVCVLAFFFLISGHLDYPLVISIPKSLGKYIFIAACTYLFFYGKYYDKLFMGESMFSGRGMKISKQSSGDAANLFTKNFLVTVQKTVAFMAASGLGMGYQYRLIMFAQIEGLFGWASGYGSGNSFIVIIAYLIRLNCARKLGANKQRDFYHTTSAYLMGGFIFALIGSLSMLLWSDASQYGYTSDKTCSYLEHSCTVPIYNEIYNGIDISWGILCFMILVNGFSACLEATLYSCLQFTFVRNASIFTFTFIFIPAMLYSIYVRNTILAVQIAWALPNLATMLIYTYKVYFGILPLCAKGVYSVSPTSRPEIRRRNSEILRRNEPTLN